MDEEMWGERFAEKIGPRLKSLYEGDWDQMPARLVQLLQELREAGR